MAVVDRNRYFVVSPLAAAVVHRKLWTGRAVGDRQPAFRYHRRAVSARLLGYKPAARRRRCSRTRRARPSLRARTSVYGRDSR